MERLVRFQDRVRVKNGISFYSGCEGLAVKRTGTGVMVRFKLDDGTVLDKEFGVDSIEIVEEKQ